MILILLKILVHFTVTWISTHSKLLILQLKQFKLFYFFFKLSIYKNNTISKISNKFYLKNVKKLYSIQIVIDCLKLFILKIELL
jgi:hypothetical protein